MKFNPSDHQSAIEMDSQNADNIYLNAHLANYSHEE